MAFFDMLDEFRSWVPYLPMHELLWRIFDRTGYADYAAAMPGGEQRTANLRMLEEKAALMRRPATGVFTILSGILKI